MTQMNTGTTTQETTEEDDFDSYDDTQLKRLGVPLKEFRDVNTKYERYLIRVDREK